MNKLTLLFMSLVVLGLSATVAIGYEMAEVKNGGTIKGKVMVTGSIPKDETITVTKDKEHCGETQPRGKYVITSKGEVRYAIVSIEGITSGKKVPNEPVIVANKKCVFHPHAQAASVGQKIIVRNGDPMLHNTHLYMNNKTLFNFALPVTGMQIEKTLKKSGLIEIHCDVHTWMTGYVYVGDNPYVATTGENGEFGIHDIPPGTYKLKVWHEALGQKEKSVTVTAGGTAEVTFEY